MKHEIRTNVTQHYSSQHKRGQNTCPARRKTPGPEQLHELHTFCNTFTNKQQNWSSNRAKCV